MLKKIVLGLIVIVGAILGFALTRPDTFEIERSATIKAPPERIFPLLNDFHSWGTWSPWEKRDPAMKRTHSGAPAGVGAVYEWEGNSDVGKGRMEIKESIAPAKIVVDLHFLAPFEAQNVTEFALESRGDSTSVRWTMRGINTYMGKVMGIFMPIEKMLGPDFEAGLANLKRAAKESPDLHVNRSLGFWRTWAIVVGTMVGSGVFLLPSVLAPYGSYSILGWLVAGAGTLFIALTLGSLAHRVPKIGGPYAYTRAAFGDFPAFLIAWGYWISLWSGVAAVAVSLSGYAAVFVPAASATPMGGAVCSLVVVWIFVMVNISGIRTAGIVQLATTLLKLAPLIVIAVAGLLMGDPTAIPALNPQQQPLPILIASVAVLTMWAYTGVEAGTIPADDVVDPARTIPRALLIGTLTATVVYVLASVGVMALLPAEEVARSTSPFADAARAVFGSIGAKFISAGAIVSIAGTLNSLVLLTGQVPRAAALDRLFPRWFEPLNARGAPAAGLVISALLASAAIGLNYSRGVVAAFTTLILISTLMALIPYLVSAAAEIVLARRAGTASGRAIAIAAVALLFSLLAIVSSGVETILYGSVLLIAGGLVYLLMTFGKRAPGSI